MKKVRQERYKVLLVEDQIETRQHLAHAISQHPQLQLVADVGTVKDGLVQLDSTAVDVLLTDLGLPDGSGLALIRKASQTGKTQSLVITVFGDEAHVVDAIKAGATGYLLKDTRAESIGESIVDLISGGSPISPAIARYLLKHVAATQTTAPTIPRTDNQIAPLTNREVEVLRFVAKGFSYSEIASILELSQHTVTTHIKNLYKKLSVGSKNEAVYEAVQLGIINMAS